MKGKTLSNLLLLSWCVMLMVACSREKPHYIIGVSQCSEDIWRNWQNAEMKMESNFHDGVELRFTTALDDSKRQIQQIDSLVESGIQLLIVAPNQRSSVKSAIDRAYDKGIPVIVFERKTDSQKYTYVVSRLDGKGNVLEVAGLKGSSPAEERHKGFLEALARYPEVKVVKMLQGDWTEPTAYQAVKDYKGDLNDIDVVFGHNDRSAMGARKVFQERQAKMPLFCGIDGLPGENGGIRLVRDSLLDASYIYPTRGDLLLQLAIDILEGKPYSKETLLTSAIVTHDNANVLLLESDEVARQAQNLDKLQMQASSYLKQLDTQRTITLMALILIALLLLTMVLFFLYHRSKVSAQRERMVNNLWNMEVPVVSDTSELSESPEQEPSEETDSEQEETPEPLFIVRFKDVVEKRLSDSTLSVDDLAAAMNLSRVQLYRKVKAISGSSPIELLRTARLNRGYQLLIQTNKTVSEIAYEIGFTAPSYFTRCFKNEFGISPSDIQAK